MPVTQKDIARHLNLSQSLVAGVLNNRPGIWASEETRQKILRAARELDYRPNAAARSLRRGKTRVAACVFFGSPGFSAIVEKLADGLAEIGYDLLVKVVPRPEQSIDRMDSLFSAGVCDAVVLWGLEHDVEAPALRLESLGVPFVVKGRFETQHPHWPQVDFDHEGMMEQAVAHLAARGHRRIAYLGYDNGLVYTQKLAAGYRQAIRARPDLVARDDFVAEIPNHLPQVEAAVLRWLHLPASERPTAVVVGTGHVGWEGIEQALARSGQRIGEEPGGLAVAGQGGAEMPLLFGEGYAYQHIDLEDLAAAIGAQMLPALLRGEASSPRIFRLLPPLRPYRSLNFPVLWPLPSGLRDN